MLSRRRCCCATSPYGYCGQPCSACGGVHITGGTVTDDNGTWDLTWNSTDGAWETSGATFQGPTVEYISGYPNCQYDGTQTLPYTWKVNCNGTGVNATLLTYNQAFPCNCAWLIKSFGNPLPPTNALFSNTLAATCTSQTITCSATIPVTGTCTSLPWPSTSVSISLDIEQPGTGPCNCGPSCSLCTPGDHVIGISVTDSNGTWPLAPVNPANLAGAWQSQYIPIPGVAGYLNQYGALDFCAEPCPPTTTGTAYYCYIANSGPCHGIALLSSWSQCYCPACEYVSAGDYYVGPNAQSYCYGGWGSIYPTNCNSTTVTGTLAPATQTNACPPGTYTVSPPTSSATATWTIESPQHRLCCSPCGIPQKDLTLSTPGGGSMTLTYYSSGPHANTWFLPYQGDSGKGVILACSSGSLVLTYQGVGGADTTCSIQPGYTCDPFHVAFTCTGLFATVYVDE